MTYGTVQANAIQGSINTFSPNSAVFRNRIINGAMVIDQRNAGASVTLPLGATYLLDRWYVYSSQSSRLSSQQNAGSVTPPSGFRNYLGLTSLSAYSITSSDEFLLTQRIEGFNTADLMWGTANAQTVTLSFWVRSSLTGTFGGTLKNSDGSRNYPYTYSVTSANTWEYKTVTIAGDTSGTWVGATNGIGLQVLFGLGVGSTFSGTAGAWTGSNVSSATGATSVVGTNGATFYITGVQLEVGTTATSFDYRPYGTELALCQRYYFRVNGFSDFTPFSSGVVRSPATNMRTFAPFPVTMRTSPTVSFSGTIWAAYGAGDNSGVTLSGSYVGPTGAMLDCAIGAGATTGSGGILYTNNTTSGQFNASAEL